MAMSCVRVLLCLVVLCSISVPIRSEPIFGKYYCDLFCADYEDDSSSDSSEDFLDLLNMFDPCLFCPSKPNKPSRPGSPVTTSTTSNPLQQSPFNFVFPPMAMNMTLGKTGSNWFLNFWPFSGSSSPNAPHSPAPATPAAGPAPAHAAGAPSPAAAPKPAAPAAPAAGNATKH